jgi:hypothetical protein
MLFVAIQFRKSFHLPVCCLKTNKTVTVRVALQGPESHISHPKEVKTG